MKKQPFFLLLALLFITFIKAEEPVKMVNPFIGSTNYGTTNPGAVCPNGLMSVVPFNVMGSDLNKHDKDAGWWSTPYTASNRFFTGYSHVNLSGVGCPDLGSLLLMPTSGPLVVDYHQYGSPYKFETARPGYYSNTLTKYNIKTEVSATMRTGISRFTFEAGQGNILLNLGEGLTNESGATVRFVSPTEIEGSKLLGTFCYNPQAVFPIYFVMRISKVPKSYGYWKKQRPMGAEADWDSDAGNYKVYTKYTKEMSGDDVGAWFTFDTETQEMVQVQMGVSFTSIENARLNLDAEQPKTNFDLVAKNASEMWNEQLSRIKVEGGTEDNRIIFYTALYHLLIHPSILNDVNGEYPAMESGQTLHTEGNRYTIYSLWDTYRNVHPFLSLVYPEKQLDMVRSMIGMYEESGWLPKWELFGRETLTMDGDPAPIVINDTWQRGLRDFDVEKAYEGMIKGAVTQQSENPLRQDNDDYLTRGYVPLRETFDNSVSHALEYYVSDWNIAQFAKALGKSDDYDRFMKQSHSYKHYYDKEFGCLRPILPDGKFLPNFNPEEGANFAPCPGFHEGMAWNYAFAVPHDIKGLIQLMGGNKKFTETLQMIFDKGLFDMGNEPDINYPYYFSQITGEEWRTQKIVRDLLQAHFKNESGGLPGNDDTGTMSTWAMYSMMGFYPVCPGDMNYTLTSPVFNKVTIKLDPKYYSKESLTITTDNPFNTYIREVKAGGKPIKGYTLTHEELTKASTLEFKLQDKGK